MWEAVDRWRVVDRCLRFLLAVATLYLAFSARESADTARQSAESAAASAAATRDIAEIVQGIADSADRSVETTREWIELSQRPFVVPTTWELTREAGTPRQAAFRAQLHDSANVPATIQKVCIVQSPAFLDYDRRRYDDITTREPSILFEPLYYAVSFPAIIVPQQQDGTQVRYLSVVYTFAREGSERRHTWRADAVARFGARSDGEISYNVTTTLVRPVGEEPC